MRPGDLRVAQGEGYLTTGDRPQTFRGPREDQRTGTVYHLYIYRSGARKPERCPPWKRSRTERHAPEYLTTMNEALLRSYIRKIISESTSVNDLAAVVIDDGDQKMAIVYDVEELKAALREERGDSSYVVSFTQISKPRGANCRGAWMIRGVAGDGKYAYGAAYALSPTGLIVPDRSNVSPSAKSAWKNYSSKAISAGLALPLDDADHPAGGEDPFHDEHHTPDPQDDCYTSHTEPYLNYAYHGGGGEGPMLESLHDSHLTVAREISDALGIPQDELESIILEAGLTFFDSMSGY